MKVIAVALMTSVIGSTSLVAASDQEMSISPLVNQIVQRELASTQQAPRHQGLDNPFLTPSLVMIGAGAAIALMADKVPQLRTQTQDYDLCAQAVGAPTGPSNRTPLCDSYTHVNRPLMWLGVGTVAAGLTVLVTSKIMRDVTIRTVAGRGVAVSKTKTF